jgi:outer membrane protein TolC
LAEHIPVSLDRVLPVALANRPDLLGGNLPIEQARLTLLLAEDNRRWDLSIVGNASIGQQNGAGTDLVAGRVAPAASAGLQLNIPLNDPALRAAEGQAASAVTVAELQLEDLRASAELQVRDAVQALETDWQAALLSRKSRDLAAKQLAVARDRLQFGRASTFEVVSAENDLRLADNAQLTASIAYLNAATTLDQQLGTTLDTWHIGLDAS